MSHWADPWCETRLGASHRRRGQPCQDASGWLEALDIQGLPVVILAVSDGHGAAQHPHSATGSRLACAIALQEAERDLALRDTAREPEAAWQRWLSQELPSRVVAGWLRAVADHWTTALAQPIDSFSPIPYGATLGLLVLTSRGWGYTGLGDWDLLELSPRQGSRIISQEPWHGGDPEATHSLCLEGAERCFASRCGWRSLGDPPGPFSLVLSSDGLRKSCCSDADFFTLAQYLSGLASRLSNPVGPATSDPGAPDPSVSDRGQAPGEPAPPESQPTPAERSLAAALDRISSQGSGDDISVAIAAWGPPDAGDSGASVPRQARLDRRRDVWLVQPPFSGWLERENRPETRVPLPGIVVAALQQQRPGADPARSHRAATAAGPSRWRARPWLLWLSAALLGVGFGVLALLPRSAPPPSRQASGLRSGADRKTLAPAQERMLRRVVAELCHGETRPRDPNASARRQQRLNGVFSARKSSFEQLSRQAGPAASAQLAALANDPLGALIAWSHDPTAVAGFSTQRLQRLEACKELTMVLGQRWRAAPRREPVGAGFEPPPVRLPR